MNPPLGIGLKVVSTFVFTLMLVCVKAVGDDVPEGEVVFARSAFAFVPIAAMLMWQGALRSSFRTVRPWSHVGRGLVGVSSMILWFAAVQRLPLPEAMAISYAAPLLIVVLSAFVLRETVRLYRWSAVVVGFVGILIILSPRLTLLAEGSLPAAALAGAGLALSSTVLSSFAAIFVRSLSQTESTGTIVIYFSLTSTAVSLLTIPLGWVIPTPGDAVLLVAAGLLGGIGQILMTQAYHHANASTIAPFEYSSMIWGLALGYLVFAEVPESALLVGGPIVIGAGVFIILRERRLGLDRSRPRRAMPPHA